MLNSWPQFCHSGQQYLFRCRCFKFGAGDKKQGKRINKEGKFVTLCTLTATSKWSPNHLHYIPVSAGIQSHQSGCWLSLSPQILSLQLKSLNFIQGRVSPYWTTMFRHIQDFAYIQFISNQQKQGKNPPLPRNNSWK